jgi:HK97 family phage portal protein
MGVLDWFRTPQTTLLERSDSESESNRRVDTLLNDIIAQRRYAFGIDRARSIPAVARARELLSSTAAAFLPLAYRDGQAMTSQPRIVTNPEAFGTRYAFIEQTMLSLIDYGCAPWRIYGRNEDPSRSAAVLPHNEMTVEWARRPFTRQFRWNGAVLPDDQIIHIDIGRMPGELHGHGPLERALDMLYPVWEAEQFAQSFFTSGGVPEVVLKVAQDLDHDEAEDLKRLWIGAANTTIRVAASGITPEFPSVDPQRAQLQEARSFGATVAATIFGIPAALLHVQTSGATITYTNPAGAVEEMVKATIAPRYLGPIETAWSQLLASTQAVRFDLADMQRADIRARFELYRMAQGNAAIGLKPWMTIGEIRANEGWGPLPPEGAPTTADSGHQFDPVEPAPEPTIPASEVLP